VSTTEEFTEFAVGAAPRLRRTAFLLCGDWRTADDLVQTALARTFVSWRRITRRDAVCAYASRTLVNAFLADRRRRGQEPLATLPPKTRVVVVMPYWSDLSVEQVSDLLGCSTAAGITLPVIRSASGGARDRRGGRGLRGQQGPDHTGLNRHGYGGGVDRRQREEPGHAGARGHTGR